MKTKEVSHAETQRKPGDISHRFHRYSLIEQKEEEKNLTTENTESTERRTDVDERRRGSHAELAEAQSRAYISLGM
jgi:hypothetical protein